MNQTNTPNLIDKKLNGVSIAIPKTLSSPTIIFPTQAIPRRTKISAGLFAWLSVELACHHLTTIRKDMIMTSTTKENLQPSKAISRKDLYQEVTDAIVAQLEKGSVPWQKPWQAGENDFSFRIPKNVSSGHNYQGINIVLLWAAAQKNEFKSNEWATYKQWKFQDEAIKKDEKGNLIVYYDTFEKEVEGEVRNIPFLKHSIVFNKDQLVSHNPTIKKTHDTKSLVERIDQVEQFVFNTGVNIDHDNTKACYNRVNDIISMPDKSLFIDTDNSTATEGYYSTLLHELTHWSGHPSRMNRDLGNKFGDKRYAVEELVAELGSAFICTEFEISRPSKEQHAGYISAWLKTLKDNKHAIFAAASEASRASNYLHKLQQV